MLSEHKTAPLPHVHYWLVGPPPLQEHRCLTCGATKTVKMTFGAKLKEWKGVA